MRRFMLVMLLGACSTEYGRYTYQDCTVQCRGREVFSYQPNSQTEEECICWNPPYPSRNTGFCNRCADLCGEPLLVTSCRVSTLSCTCE